MIHRSRAAWVAVIAVGWMGPAPASAQDSAGSGAETASGWALPRLPDGQPDLQGYWTTQTFTPLERPEHLADKAFFTEEEAAALQAQLTAEGVDPSARDAVEIADPEARERRLYQVNRDPSYVHYDNQVWLRTPVPKGLSTRRTSLVTDPPDGRIPPLTPEAAERLAAEAEARRLPSAFDSHETRPFPERCIVWAHEGPPNLPPAYNDIHQFFQTPDYVVLFTELNTNPPRIIPSTGARTSRRRSVISRAIPAAGGRATPWSSKRRTTPRGGAFADPPTRCTCWSASRASLRIRSATSSRSTTRTRGPARGAWSSR